MGLRQLCEVQRDQVAGPAPGSQQPQAGSPQALQPGGRVTGKLPSRNGPGGAGQQWLNVSWVCPSDQEN